MSDFRKIKKHYSPLGWQKMLQLFFYWSDIAEKSFGEKKAFTLSIFQNIFWVCLFPMIFLPFWQKFVIFYVKSRILVGNRQIQKFLKKMKSLNPGDISSSPKCYNISNNDQFGVDWKLGLTTLKLSVNTKWSLFEIL